MRVPRLMNGLRLRTRLWVINNLNDSRTAHKTKSFTRFSSLLAAEYVTRMAHFDLVEITLHSIDSAEDFALSLLKSVMRKTDGLRIYVIRFMAWKWSIEIGWRRKNEQRRQYCRGTFTRNEGNISRGQCFFKYYAFFSFRNLAMSFLGNRSIYTFRLDTFWYPEMLSKLFFWEASGSPSWGTRRWSFEF